MTDDVLADLGTFTRLGDVARPAGRTPLRRFVYAAHTGHDVETVRQHVTATLERVTGPLRCTPVDVTVALGRTDVADLLHHLNQNGQTTAQLAPAVTAYGRVAAHAEAHGQEAYLVVASCAALTGQAAASVPYS